MERQLGNYTLGPLLARGGSGEVYAGHHRHLGEDVAIKVMRLGPGDRDTAAALIAEASRTRAIDHPNVVRVLDVGADADTWYLVMERVDGEDLAARLARTGPVGEAEARRLGAAIADGLAAAHARGIVHRDVKPANVMLGGDTPKLIDFGIAKALGDRSAVTTQRRIGTPAYMAPEQLVGGQISPAVDVWALGVILFELVAGALPFAGYDDGRCPQLAEAAPRVATVAPVSAAYDAIVARCLDPDPGRRPATAAELATALRAPAGDGDRHTVDLGAVGTATATAVPAPDPVRTPPPPSRRPRQLAAVAIVAGVAALAIVAAVALRAPAARVTPDAAQAADAAPLRVTPVVPAGPPDAAPVPVPVPDAGRQPPPDHHHHDHGGPHADHPDARPHEGLD